jgi:hypothetical protein
MYKNYVPVHSDFIIHWTGKDIEKDSNKDWTSNHTSLTDPETTERYLQRLKNILKYGLWMTDNSTDVPVANIKKDLKIPNHSRTCFTELKLSQARFHAAEYGRLGIGFKRFFLFDRLGAPMLYFIEYRPNWLIPPLLNIDTNDYYKCFFKTMTQKSTDTTIQYKFFDESEWRIIYSEEIRKKLSDDGLDDINKHFIRSKDINDQDFKGYCLSVGKCPDFLIPIRDKWFAMIIYPSIEVKVKSQSNDEIRSLIKSIKNPYVNQSNRPIRNPAPLELYNYPIEIDIDTCRNF